MSSVILKENETLDSGRIKEARILVKEFRWTHDSIDH